MKHTLFPLSDLFDDFKEKSEYFSPKERLNKAYYLLKDIKELGEFLVSPEHRSILYTITRRLRQIIFDLSGEFPWVILADPLDFLWEIEPDEKYAQLYAYVLMRCHRVLFKFREFDSDSLLRTLPRSEQFPYRDDLPVATSKTERIGKTVAYLLQKQLKQQQPVLLCFLTALRDREPVTSGLREELERLHNAMEQVLSITAKETFQLTFVNRETEKKKIVSFLIDHFYMLVHAPSGMGKTYLLREVQREIETFQGQPVWIDLASCSHCPIKAEPYLFLDAFCQQALGASIPDMSEDEKTAVAQIGDKLMWMDEEVVLFLDHIDSGGRAFFRWLLSTFLEPLATEWVPVRVVAASQQIIPEWEEIKDKQKSQTHSLSPLDDPVIIEQIINNLVRRFGAPSVKERKARQDEAWLSDLKTMVDGLLSISHGHPRTMAKLLGVAAEQDGFQHPTFFTDHSGDLSKRCLAPVVDEHILRTLDEAMREAFLNLCIFRYLWASLLGSLSETPDELGTPWEPFSSSGKLWRIWWSELKETHLIERLTTHPLSRISPVIRQIIAQVLHAEDECLYRARHRRARQEYERLLTSQPVSEPRHAACLLELFYHATQDGTLSRAEATTLFKKKLNDFLSDFAPKKSKPLVRISRVHVQSSLVLTPNFATQRVLISGYRVGQAVTTDTTKKPSSLKVISQLKDWLYEDTELQQAINQLAGPELYDQLIEMVEHFLKEEEDNDE